MAVDTAQKRYSMINLITGVAPLLPVFEPDGSVDLDDRQHMLGKYSGIAFGAPPGVTIMALERATFRRVAGRVFGRVN